MLGQNASLSEFKKIEIISSIFSDHSAIRKKKNNYKKKMQKHNNKLSNMQLNNKWFTEKSKRKSNNT